MQSAGQYGVNEVPQFVVGGSQHPSPHLFSLVHDMSLSPASSGHTHPGHLNHHQQQQHLYSHLNQVQQQQQQQQSSSKEAPHPHLNLHHHHPHQQQQQTSHSPHQQRQQHQHVQQQQHHQHMQQQVVQQQQVQQQTLQQKHHHHHHQQQVTVQHQQNHMVNELGPESSEEAAAPGSSVVSRPSPSMYTKQMSAVLARDLALGHDETSLQGRVDPDEEEHGGIEGGGEEEGLLLRSTQEGSGGNRWPRQETLLLIKIRSEMDSNFRDSGLKGPLWEDVARKLSELGYNRSAKKCKEKFENIHKYYKKTKDGKAGRQDGKNYRFFSELDALYAGRNTSTTHAADATAAAAALMLPGLAAATHDGFMRNAGLSPAAFRAAAENAGGLGFAAVSEGSSEENDHEEQPDPDLDEHGNNNNNNNTSNKKRKRKESETGIPAAARTITNSGSSSKKVMFLESLVNKLMDQQESMQRKFLESMEKREQERIVREEAWKTQEMERLNREHELRTQEHTLALSRDAALVAVLQKLTGETLQLPPPPSPPRPSSSLHATATTQPAHNQNRSHHQQELLLQEEGEKVLNQGSSPFDPHSSNSSSKRWPTPEVHALIRLRMEMESRFQETGPKGPLWEEISTAMASMGYTRNPKRCKEKWENVNKYYRKAKESNKKRAENSKTCPYFQQLDTLYNPAAAAAAGAQIAGPRNPASKPADHEQTLEELQSEMPDHLQQEHHLMRDDDDDDQSAAKQLVQGDAVQKELGGPLKKTTEL